MSFSLAPSAAPYLTSFSYAQRVSRLGLGKVAVLGCPKLAKQADRFVVGAGLPVVQPPSWQQLHDRQCLPSTAGTNAQHGIVPAGEQ